jgi:type II secretory pathway pseudopilin PulG
MYTVMNFFRNQSYPRLSKHGFSLIEVVLAIGIFLVTVLALVGLLGPTLQSVDEVEKSDEVSSIVNTVNAFLQSSPEIAVAGETKFETIYKGLRAQSYLTLFVFRAYDSNDNVGLKVGFFDLTVGEPNASIVAGDFVNAAGTVYRVVLTASSVTPVSSRSGPTNGVYTLSKDFAGGDPYPEGYLAMEVRIFAEEPSPQFDPANIPPGYSTPFTLSALSGMEPIFTYNTAIVR